jgi:hypothetical protein
MCPARTERVLSDLWLSKMLPVHDVGYVLYTNELSSLDTAFSLSRALGIAVCVQM